MKVFCLCLLITVTVMFTGRRITTLKRHCLNSCLLSIGESNLCSNWKFIHCCYITTVIYVRLYQCCINQFGTRLVLAKDDQQQQHSYSMIDMSDVNKSDHRQIYALIANIPSFYHSADLRNYFSQFVEQGGFDCFHFRHRPEIIRSHEENGSVIACDGDAQKSSVSRVDGHSPSEETSANTRRGKSLCCVVRLRQSKFVELVRMYHRKCWLDRKGESIRSLCCISKIKFADTDSGKSICCQSSFFFKLPVICVSTLTLIWCINLRCAYTLGSYT